MIVTCETCGRPLRRAPVYAHGAMWYCAACRGEVRGDLRRVEQSEIDEARAERVAPVAIDPSPSGKTRLNLRRKMREMGMPLVGAAAQIHDARRRKTHCCMGHEFTPENTRIDVRGMRVCRTCSAIRSHDDWVNRKKKKLPAAETA